ncbi:MAG TPA: response regulator [Thermoanaerobaculia bacterium]|nr:response regulator [Thermoanaerobaculia bacterium]
MALVEGDRDSAEMLHTFFRLMELECSLIHPDASAVSNVRRLSPDVLILDLDLPDLRALEIARELRSIPTILLTSSEPQLLPIDALVLRKPGDRFEELLHLFEMVLALEP